MFAGARRHHQLRSVCTRVCVTLRRNVRCGRQFYFQSDKLMCVRARARARACECHAPPIAHN